MSASDIILFLSIIPGIILLINNIAEVIYSFYDHNVPWFKPFSDRTLFWSDVAFYLFVGLSIFMKIINLIV